MNRIRGLRRVAVAIFAALPFLAGTAHADVDLIEAGDWTFYSGGRVNSFLSYGFGDGFPQPVPPPLNEQGGETRSSYTIIQGWSGWRGDPPQEGADGKYQAARIRSGFVGSIFGFGVRRPLTETMTIRGYVGIWTSIASVQRKALPDSPATLTNTDARQGYLRLSAPWGELTAGRDLTIFGRISTETDYNYAHGVGLGLPCMDNAGNPGCGHIGTGVLGASFGSGFVYSTPEFGGLKLTAGLYDPVRILGGWVAADYPRPEAQLAWTQSFAEDGMVKVAVEGIYQKLRYPEAPRVDAAEGVSPADITTDVWGVNAGARFELGMFRVGAAVYHGKGLGFYSSLQNDPVMFDTETGELRTFTGLYGQTAVVLGAWQVGVGLGQTRVAQLANDIANLTVALPQSQSGLSATVAYKASDSLAFDVEFFRFMTKWYAAPNALYATNQDGSLMTDANGAPVVMVNGYLPQHEQNVNFLQAGATLQW